MVITFPRQRRYRLSFSRPIILLFAFTWLLTCKAGGQCLTSANPVGGSANLLVLGKSTIRVIGFYRFSYGDQYYEGTKKSDFDLISRENYNYAGSIIGYGMADRVTLEAELGYFINKTQVYNIDPEYSLRGGGLSNALLSIKYGLLKDDEKRFFISSSIGAKIPFSTKPQSRDGVELPVEVQPTIGAFGMVFQGFMVKEKPITGTRYFLTSRLEINSRNRKEYKLGTSVISSFFLSKHLMLPWLKGDWTTILQLRNETRGVDRTITGVREATGSTIFYISPQVNHFIREKWNVSLIADIPVYRHFTGIQMTAKYGITLALAREF
jgi:hypothetical protein